MAGGLPAGWCPGRMISVLLEQRENLEERRLGASMFLSLSLSHCVCANEPLFVPPSLCLSVQISLFWFSTPALRKLKEVEGNPQDWILFLPSHSSFSIGASSLAVKSGAPL